MACGYMKHRHRPSILSTPHPSHPRVRVSHICRPCLGTPSRDSNLFPHRPARHCLVASWSPPGGRPGTFCRPTAARRRPAATRRAYSPDPYPSLEDSALGIVLGEVLSGRCRLRSRIVGGGSVPRASGASWHTAIPWSRGVARPGLVLAGPLCIEGRGAPSSC
jgi:hypothetical protein